MKILVACLALFLAGPALGQTKIVADQPDSPLTLKQFVADPGSAPRPGGRSGGGPLDRILFLARGVNVADQEIEAADITFVAFNAYGEMLTHTTTSLVQTIGEEQMGQYTAVTETPDAATFHTAVAFVKRVRLADGTIWEAGMRPVVRALRGVDPDFDPSVLTD